MNGDSLPDTLNGPFWMVWSPEAGAPTIPHATMAAAQHEAVRLASKHPNRRFFVLEAKTMSRTKQPVVTETLEVRF